MVVAAYACAPEAAVAVGLLEGPAAAQRYEVPDVDDLTIYAEFVEVRLFASERQGVGAELSVSSRMAQRNRPELAIERDGGVVTLRFTRNELPVSRTSLDWGPKLTVSLPAEVELTVHTTTGAVVVQGLRSERLQVLTQAGDVYVGDCAAPLQVAGGAGALRVARSHGEKRLTSTSGAIEVVDSRGDVVAHTLSGEQRFQGIDGDVTVLRDTSASISEHRGRLIVEEP